MKKYAALIGLAVLALPACSNSHGYSNNGYNQNDQYPAQYAARDNANHNAADDNRGDHKDWKEAKLNAMVDHFFAKADTNHDGKISWKEFEAFARKEFRKADTNHDGELTRDEVIAMKKHEWHEIHKEMHEDGGDEQRSDMRSDRTNMNTSDNSNWNSNDTNSNDNSNRAVNN